MRDIFIDRYADGTSVIHRLDPRSKLIGLMALVAVQVLTDIDHVLTFATYGGLLFGLLILSRIPWRYAAGRLALIAPFVLLVAVFSPFFSENAAKEELIILFGAIETRYRGWMAFWNAAVKGSLGALALIVLSSTTRFSDLLKGLEKLRVPHVFVFMLGIAYRYLYVFAEEATSMLRALKSRGFFGRWIWQSASLGRLVGNLFLRAYERGERVHMAMVARGFDGTPRTAQPLVFRMQDVLFVAFMILAVIIGQALRVFGSGVL